MLQQKEQLIKRLNDYLLILQKEDFSFLKTFIDEVQSLNKKLAEGEIIIPLVGEFSCGKSSLVNAILNKKVLPIDITPTTFLVYEVRFSCDKDYIEIYYEKEKELIEGLMDLNTKDYTNARLVKIYSTFNKIPKNIVLVDIPGLSSVISQHDEIITEYVPKADAVFVAVDVNQGTLTQTTLKFLDYVKVLDKKIFVILTKADTKTEKEIEEVKQYIKKQFDFVHSIIITSAKDERLDEFYSLINNVKNMSGEILIENISKKFALLCNETIRLLNEQIEKSKLDISEIEKRINETRDAIENLKKEINKRVDNYKIDIDSAVELAVDKFYRLLEGKADSLADTYFSDKENFKSEFNSEINRAQEIALKLFQKELELRTKEFQNKLTLILPDSGISPTTSKILTGIGEVLNIILLNLFLPGGIIPALAAGMVLKILTKIPKVGKYAGIVNQIVTEIVTEIGNVVAKSYIKKKVIESIKDITDAFQEELSQQGNLLFRELKIKLTEKLEGSIAPYNRNLQKLLEEKKGKESEFKEYITNLKNAVSQLKRACGAI